MPDFITKESNKLLVPFPLQATTSKPLLPYRADEDFSSLPPPFLFIFLREQNHVVQSTVSVLMITM